MTTRYNYKRPFCEVCGSRDGGSVSVEGWNTCVEHFRVPKPAEPLFDWNTGERIKDEIEKPQESDATEGDHHEK